MQEVDFLKTWAVLTGEATTVDLALSQKKTEKE
jgi:hypothetical protein